MSVTGGFTPEQSALAYRLLAQFVASCFSPRSNAPGVTPVDQVKQRFEELDQEAYPSAAIVGASFAALKTKDLFEAGLALLLDGFETWLAK